MKIGLAGYVCDTGIGTLIRWLWKRLPFDHLLAVKHPILGMGGNYEAFDDGRPLFIQANCTATRGAKFLAGLDAVLTVERTTPDDFFNWCKERKIRTHILCMAEWVDLNKPWFRHADRLIAPTRHCYDHLVKLGQQARSVYVPCPVDLTELPFRLRDRADSFMFSNGFGGANMRKGMETVVEFAAKNPQLPLTIYSQQAAEQFLHSVPHVRLIGQLPKAASLYEKQAVAIQPSRYEGLGLGIVESLASGLPVLTTDAAPMHEFVKGAYGEEAKRFLIRVREVQQVNIWSHLWPAHIADAAHLSELANSLYRQPVDHISLAGRRFLEKNHGDAAFDSLWAALQL